MSKLLTNFMISVGRLLKEGVPCKMMHTGRRYFLNYLWILEKTLMEKYIQCVDYWISKNLVTDIYHLVAFQDFIFGVAIGDYRRSSRWKCYKVRRRLLWWMFWCTFLESSCFFNQIAVFPRAYIWGRLHGNLSVFFKNPSFDKIMRIY